jgi:hypothetical protein
VHCYSGTGVLTPLGEWLFAGASPHSEERLSGSKLEISNRVSLYLREYQYSNGGKAFTTRNTLVQHGAEKKTRRSFLQLSAGGLAILSGCGTIVDSSSEENGAKLHHVRVSSVYPEPRTVGVLIEGEEDIVYWQSITVDAATEDTQGSYAIPQEKLPESTGEWTFYIRNTHSGDYQSVTITEEEPLTVDLTIWEDNTVQVRYGTLSSNST